MLKKIRFWYSGPWNVNLAPFDALYPAEQLGEHSARSFGPKFGIPGYAIVLGRYTQSFIKIQRTDFEKLEFFLSRRSSSEKTNNKKQIHDSNLHCKILPEIF